jgi:ssRNA-specific RNase YbeY (16S rRNA maturation enzyme)
MVRGFLHLPGFDENEQEMNFEELYDNILTFCKFQNVSNK